MGLFWGRISQPLFSWAIPKLQLANKRSDSVSITVALCDLTQPRVSLSQNLKIIKKTRRYRSVQFAALYHAYVRISVCQTLVYSQTRQFQLLLKDLSLNIGRNRSISR